MKSTRFPGRPYPPIPGPGVPDLDPDAFCLGPDLLVPGPGNPYFDPEARGGDDDDEAPAVLLPADGFSYRLAFLMENGRICVTEKPAKARRAAPLVAVGRDGRASAPFELRLDPEDAAASWLGASVLRCSFSADAADGSGPAIKAGTASVVFIGGDGPADAKAAKKATARFLKQAADVLSGRPAKNRKPAGYRKMTLI